MKLQFTYGQHEIEDGRKWFSFYPAKSSCGFKITYSPYNYFDPRAGITTSVTSILALILPFISLWLLPLTVIFLFYSWGEIYIKLPLNSGIGDEAEHPEYGVYFYDFGGKLPNEIWIRLGWKSKTFKLPWYMQWYSTSLKLRDGSWETEKKGDKKDFFEKEWQDKAWMNHYMYEYRLKSGEIQKATATVTVEKREWRPAGLFFTSLFAKTRKTIEVEFDREMGERAGEWKGGTVGCNYEIKSGESPHQTLRRMERERKFN